jgi:membrane associated rhomboid family serine protease
MSAEKQKIVRALRIPLLFVILIIIIKIFEYSSGFSFTSFGIYPGRTEGLRGIILSPLIHANYSHLFSNAVPLMILGFSLFYFYPESSVKVALIIYFVTNVFVWLFGRPSFHIGSSGIVYGLAAFIFFSGIFKRDTRAITLAVLVTFIYGGMVWGILPIEEGISWESHLSGGFIGLVCAVMFKGKDKYRRYEWEDEESDISPGKLEIRYDDENNM